MYDDNFKFPETHNCGDSLDRVWSLAKIWVQDTY